MKILVFSDSHGRIANIKKAMDEHLRHGGIDRVFFLGDGARDIMTLATVYPDIPFEYVLGNCDSTTGNTALLEKLVCVGDVKFLLIHGHNHGVKEHIQRAVDYAIEKGADVLLYGHTHVASDLTLDGSYGGHVRAINPGSCSSSYFGSYATVYVEGRQVICGFGSL